MEQDEPRAGLGIHASGNLHVIGNEITTARRFKWMFPDTNHDALRAIVVLDVAGFEEIPFLVGAMPVCTVILHDQLVAAGQAEHHVEPDQPTSHRDAHVLAAVPDHVVEQLEEGALQLGGRLIAGQRAQTVPALDLVPVTPKLLADTPDTLTRSTDIPDRAPARRVCDLYAGADASLLVAALIWSCILQPDENMLVSAARAAHGAPEQHVWLTATTRQA